MEEMTLRPRTWPPLDQLRKELLRELPGAPLGEPLVGRYRINYGIPSEVPIDEESVLRHWHLERAWTRRLVDSRPGERPELFAAAYDELYSTLPWLNLENRLCDAGEEIRALDILSMLGPIPRTILELGSGRGRLIRRLAEAGHLCRGSDVSEHRVPEQLRGCPNLSWSRVDAVRVDEQVDPESYDVVLSSELIEHLHPDDLSAHLAAVHRVLRAGGWYLFTTPHAFLGPMDLSRVVGAGRPMGMHLREYTYEELEAAVRHAGFRRLEAGFRLPMKLGRLLHAGLAMRLRPGYLGYLITLEKALARIGSRERRRSLARLLKIALFREVPLVARKSGSMILSGAKDSAASSCSLR